MPAQCPSCGRFLSNALVTGLDAADAPCPRCGISLGPEMFGRPPRSDAAETDGPPETGHGGDPLAGWDTQRADVIDLGGGRLPDAVMLLGAGGAGMLIGAAVSRARNRRTWAMLGGLVGLAVVAVSRRIWELES